MNLLRYVRAGYRALLMTLRGEKPVPVRHPELHQWSEKTVAIIDLALASGNAGGLDQTARRRLEMQIDKRDMNVEILLQTLRHHAAVEYPYLLKNFTHYSIMTVQATNLNDQYLVLKLLDVESLPAEMRNHLQKLRDHLAALPQPSEEA